VELSGLEPLTSCMPSGGSTSTRVSLCRSPSSPVPARPPPSTCVAVLSCCTAPIRAEEHPRRPNWRPNQRQPCEKGYRRMPPGAPRYPVKQPWMLTLRHAPQPLPTPAQPRKPRQPRPQAARRRHRHSGTPPQKPAMINLTKITGIMPMSQSCLLAHLCADLYVANRRSNVNLALQLSRSDAAARASLPHREPSVLQTAIHAHALRPLTCECLSGRPLASGGVPSRFRERGTTFAHAP